MRSTILCTSTDRAGVVDRRKMSLKISWQSPFNVTCSGILVQSQIILLNNTFYYSFIYIIKYLLCTTMAINQKPLVNKRVFTSSCVCRHSKCPIVEVSLQPHHNLIGLFCQNQILRNKRLVDTPALFHLIHCVNAWIDLSLHPQIGSFPVYTVYIYSSTSG